MKSISLFFPAYNEEENILSTVQDAIHYMDTLSCEYEIIIINDHSTDNTKKLLQQHYPNHARVKIIDNFKNTLSGYGGALRCGFAACKNDLIFFTDADRQFDITELGTALEAIKHSDYVIGYRINRQDPIYRSINAWAYSLLVKLLLGVFVKDINCAFKLFRRDVINSIEINSNSALVNAEILFKLKNKNYNFIEIAVHHYPRKLGKQSGANIMVIVRMFIDLFKLKLNKL